MSGSRILTLVAVLATMIPGSAPCFATQDVADAWTSIAFTLPIPAPYKEAKIVGRVAGAGLTARLAELTVQYGKNTVRIPSELLQRLPSPLLSTMNLFHPPRSFDDHYHLTLSFEFGEPFEEEPFDFPTAQFRITDGRLMRLTILSDGPEAEAQKLEWSRDRE